MSLVLCPNCRLPVQQAVRSCPLCGAERGESVSRLRLPVAAALAMVTALALLARGRFA
jgi:predicted amidophosphoribosyltransferase